MNFLLLIILSLLVACGSGSRAGGTSGHENVLQAMILDSASKPVAGARAWLRPLDYLSGDLQSTIPEAISDANGLVQFFGLDSGEFWMEVRQGNSGSFTKVSLESTDSMITQLSTLGLFQQCFGVETAGDTLRIFGMDRLAILSPSGCAILDSMPVGPYQVMVAKDSLNTYATAHGIQISIPAGTPVSGAVWIPLRLGQTDFNYDLASGKSGIWATDRNGNPLGMEVEEWDSAPGSAIVWIRLDSLPGLGTKVFLFQDTQSVDPLNAFSFVQDGWFHVWHFARKDTLFISNHGTLDGAGILGSGRLFTDSSQYLNTPIPTSLSVQGILSLWIRLDSSNRSPEIVFADAGGFKFMSIDTGASSHLAVKILSGVNDTLTLNSSVPIGNGAWHLVTLVWKLDGTASLFADGLAQDNGTLVLPLRNISDSLQVGKFVGAVDELRLGSGGTFNGDTPALDATWQVRGSTLITWSPF
jgi:hypothetical protein